jgi:hypothetical protein
VSEDALEAAKQWAEVNAKAPYNSLRNQDLDRRVELTDEYYAAYEMYKQCRRWQEMKAAFTKALIT